MDDGNTRLPALCAGKAPDEKLKISELRTNLAHGSRLQSDPPDPSCLTRVW